MVVDLFQQLHDEYIEDTYWKYVEIELDYAESANVQWDPDSDEIPF